MLNLDGHHTPIHRGIHKGWRPPKAAATLCGDGAKRRLMGVGVVAVLVEDFGLPKSAVGMVGQTSRMFKL